MAVDHETMVFCLDLPYAYGEPSVEVLLKSENQHFVVHEQLGFSPEGDGEHLFLHVESNGDNTQWVADQLAIGVGVKSVDIGFCGLKDRNAITRQWFSVYDPKRDLQALLDAAFLPLKGSRLLAVSRGQSKLRRGQHEGNSFVITLPLAAPIDQSASERLERRLVSVQQFGVPNYFGLQRFGREGNNLPAFQQWLSRAQEQRSKSKKGRGSRKPKGIILSAARSYLFNQVLCERVKEDSWKDLLLGDVALNDLPTAPLWGRGRSATAGLPLDLECRALRPLQSWADALEHLGLSQERRALVSRPQNLQWKLSAEVLTLAFELPPGEYATGVLREVCQCREPSRLSVV